MHCICAIHYQHLRHPHNTGTEILNVMSCRVCWEQGLDGGLESGGVKRHVEEEEEEEADMYIGRKFPHSL